MTEEIITLKEKSFKLGEAVAAVSDIDVSFCYQCGKCSTGCPVAYAMDLTPTQLIHAMQLGLHDVVYKSNTMWLCVSCLTCSTRCPQDVDIPGAFDAVKILMERNKETPREPDVLAVTKSFAQNLRWFGRMYELGMVGVIKLRTRKFTQDLGMGMKMLKKNKFNLLPGFEGAREIRKIFRRVEKQEKA
jgi:heterodisulfide reductase subunit C